MGVARDFDHLVIAVEKAFAPALLLAFGSATLLAAASPLLILVPGEMGALVAVALLLGLHGAFITTLTWKLVHPPRPVLRTLWSPGLPAGAILALPIIGFALLDAMAGSYSCADGGVIDRSPIPDLPWLWIGWSVATILALPARAIGLVVGERPPLIPLGRRVLLMLPFVPPIFILGYVFQAPRQPNCTPPFDGFSFGFMEGGLFLLPLLGAFWFISSFSMAVLSAEFVSRQPPSGASERGSDAKDVAPRG